MLEQMIEVELIRLRQGFGGQVVDGRAAAAGSGRTQPAVRAKGGPKGQNGQNFGVAGPPLSAFCQKRFFYHRVERGKQMDTDEHRWERQGKDLTRVPNHGWTPMDTNPATKGQKLLENGCAGSPLLGIARLGSPLLAFSRGDFFYHRWTRMNTDGKGRLRELRELSRNMQNTQKCRRDACATFRKVRLSAESRYEIKTLSRGSGNSQACQSTDFVVKMHDNEKESE